MRLPQFLGPVGDTHTHTHPRETPSASGTKGPGQGVSELRSPVSLGLPPRPTVTVPPEVLLAAPVWHSAIDFEKQSLPQLLPL